MSACPSCGAELRADDRYCRFCGAAQASGAPQPPAGVPPAGPPGRYMPPKPRPAVPGSTNAVASFVCVLVGFFVCPIAYPFAAYLGVRALNELPPDADSGTRLMAQIGKWGGIVFSVLIAVAVLLIVVALVGIGLSQQGG